MDELWGGYVMSYFGKKNKKKLKKRTTIGSSENCPKIWDPPLNFPGRPWKKKFFLIFF